MIWLIDSQGGAMARPSNFRGCTCALAIAVLLQGWLLCGGFCVLYKCASMYKNKLASEMDLSDLFDALCNGEKVIALYARKPFGFEA
jgi:hypothetical protein